MKGSPIVFLVCNVFGSVGLYYNYRIRVEIEDLDNTINRLDLRDSCITPYPIMEECKLLSGAHATFPSIDHTQQTL